MLVTHLGKGDAAKNTARFHGVDMAPNLLGEITLRT